MIASAQLGVQRNESEEALEILVAVAGKSVQRVQHAGGLLHVGHRRGFVE